MSFKIDNIRSISTELSPTAPFSKIPSNPSFVTSSLASLSCSSFRFIQDVIGCFTNLFCFPFLGITVFYQHLLLLSLLPLVLPILVLAQIIEICINCLTCNYANSYARGSAFSVPPLSDSHRQKLHPFIYKNAPISQDHQLQLLHVMNTYFTFVNTCSEKTKENDYFQGLIQITIDGTSQLFTYSPNTPKATLLNNYLKFVLEKASPHSIVKHTFIGLDYLYFAGYLKMRVHTDICKVALDQPIEEESAFFGCCGPLFPWLFRSSLQKNKGFFDVDHFDLWPGNTRKMFCNIVNKCLKKTTLERNQLSLFSLENIIQLGS